MDTDSTIDAPGGEAPAETSRTDDIAQAIEQVEAREAPPAAAPPAGTPPPPAGGEPPAGRPRDASGRFQPGGTPPAPGAIAKPAAAPGAPLAAPDGKPALAPAQAAPGAPKAPPDPNAAPAPSLRAPASWKPGAREHWGKLPSEVQQEVARRESEVARTMHESARAREALTHIQQVVGPYAQNIAASGSDALGAIENFFRADNTLRHGSPQEKAQMAASIIKQYGIDIATLDAALVGAQMPSDPNSQLAEQLRREMRAQMQPVLGFFNQMQGHRQQQMQQVNAQAGTLVEGFSQDAAHEFFEDVREEMADIIDLATARGREISLQDAYDRAIKLNPQIAEIVSRRAETEQVNVRAQAAQRARRTAASIGGSPAPAGAVPGPAGDDRRAAVAAAWDDSANS